MVEVTPHYKIQLARELRRDATPAEALLWSRLRGNRLGGLKFRRQHPIGRFLADFCCEAHRLVVELDGEYHGNVQQGEFDREREAHLLGRGYTVLRFSNREVFADLKGVVGRIRGACCPHPPASSPAAGEGE